MEDTFAALDHWAAAALIPALIYNYWLNQQLEESPYGQLGRRLALITVIPVGTAALLLEMPMLFGAALLAYLQVLWAPTLAVYDVVYWIYSLDAYGRLDLTPLVRFAAELFVSNASDTATWLLQVLSFLMATVVSVFQAYVRLKGG